MKTIRQKKFIRKTIKLRNKKTHKKNKRHKRHKRLNKKFNTTKKHAKIYKGCGPPHQNIVKLTTSLGKQSIPALSTIVTQTPENVATKHAYITTPSVASMDFLTRHTEQYKKTIEDSRKKSIAGILYNNRDNKNFSQNKKVQDIIAEAKRKPIADILRINENADTIISYESPSDFVPKLYEIVEIYGNKLLAKGLNKDVVNVIVNNLESSDYQSLIDQARITNVDTSSKNINSVMDTAASIVNYYFTSAVELIKISTRNTISPPIVTTGKILSVSINSPPLLGGVLLKLVPDISSFATFISMGCSMEFKFWRDRELYEIINWDVNTANSSKYKRQVETYYKSLVTSIKDIVEGVFINSANNCSSFIPTVLSRVIHPKNISDASSLLKEKFSDEELVKMNNFCNKFMSYYINSIQATGSFNLDSKAKEILMEIKDEYLQVVKDTIYFSLKSGLEKIITDISQQDDTDIELQEVKSTLKLLEENKDTNFSSFFDNITFESVIDFVKNTYDEMKDLLNKNLLEESVDTKTVAININSNPSTAITAASNKLSKNIENSIKQKVRIGDFVKNSTAIITLLTLYTEEVDSHIENSKPYSQEECILNVLDLKLDSILDDVCEQFAKPQLGETLICRDEFKRLAGEFYNKPVSEIMNDRLIMKKLLMTVAFLMTSPDNSDKKDLPSERNKTYSTMYSILEKDNLSLFQLYILYNNITNRVVDESN
jgi:hypothetical protein